jgi:N-acetylmuramic acid 6-phosphate etherase
MNTADEFLKIKDLFQLGVLPTEQAHPLTKQLSQWAHHDLDHAFRVLREIDVNALRKIHSMKLALTPLFQAVDDVLEDGGRIFLVGCGATGRLSLSLEYLWKSRGGKEGLSQADRVISLMAGGDVALVHSLEGFEDFPEYGARHLRQLGFRDGDLLIATTEGGETPYVIGATEEAARVSKRSPYFLYCNPAEILKSHVQRSKAVLENPKINSVCLFVGPMALSGSTRMQASTVLMLAVGLALEYRADVDLAFSKLNSWIEFLAKAGSKGLREFTVRESDSYIQGDCTVYSVDSMAITVFTDTTERAPTFNLAGFDNAKMLTDRHSLTYVMIPSTKSVDESWNALLSRPARPLDWAEVHAKTTMDYLRGFDFSSAALEFRKKIMPDVVHKVFEVSKSGSALRFGFDDIESEFALADLPPLFDHLTLKLLMNMHSTLLMGRMDRYRGNVMTWVYPSNGKLVDRAARYSQQILNELGIAGVSYDEVVRAQYECKKSLSPKESIVLKTVEKLIGRNIDFKD